MFRIKYSREVILKVLFQLDALGMNPEEIPAVTEGTFELFKGLSTEERAFVSRVVGEVMADLDRIDRLISDNLIGWKLSRLTPVDRNLLRMGIVEYRSLPEKAVIIDEAVRIAKKYGEQDSYRIVNAVLDKVII